MLQKQDRIVAKFWQHGAKKYANTTMKFGVNCPKTVDQALALDKKNCNTLWFDAIAKEMKNFRISFDIREKGDPPPVGHQLYGLRCEDGGLSAEGGEGLWK